MIKVFFQAFHSAGVEPNKTKSGACSEHVTLTDDKMLSQSAFPPRKDTKRQTVRVRNLQPLALTYTFRAARRC